MSIQWQLNQIKNRAERRDSRQRISPDSFPGNSHRTTAASQSVVKVKGRRRVHPELESASGAHHVEAVLLGEKVTAAAVPGSMCGVDTEPGSSEGVGAKLQSAGARGCLLDFRRGKVQTGAPRFNKSKPSL